MNSERLTILIPTRNRPGILATTLARIRKAGFDNIPIWVYDDCSENPAAIRSVVESFPKAQLLRGENRVGQAQGRNVLMRACGSQLALLLDDDSFPDDAAWFEKTAARIPGSARVAIVTFQYRSMADGALSLPPGIQPGPSASFLGGASLLHIPSVLAVGGFRDRFIYGYEEPELALRLWSHGFTVWRDPSVLIHHNHFENPHERRDHKEYDYLYARNGILMSSLNMPLCLGLPHGLGRSLRRALRTRRNPRANLLGTLAGIGLSFGLWRERKPCSIRDALGWLRFSREHAR